MDTSYISKSLIKKIYSETEKGNRYILTMYDELTKYLVAEPIKEQTACAVAEAFVDRFICVYGAPIQICSDQGGCFIAAVFKQTCKILKINKTRASPFHPQTSGGVERSHRTIGEYLRIYTQNGREDWDTWIPKAVAAHNSCVHQAHKFTPHELIFGEKLDISTLSHVQEEPSTTYDDYVTDLRRKLIEL